MSLAKILEVANDIEAASSAMVERCAGYQETTRVLHRELEYLLRLHHKEPGIFNLNPDINHCVVEFFKASALIARDAENVRSVGLDNAEHNLHLVSERLAHIKNMDDHQAATHIDTLLESCEQNIRLARQYVHQLNAYVQYHSRVLKTIKPD